MTAASIEQAILCYLDALERRGWRLTKINPRSALVRDPGWVRSGRAWA